MTRPAPPVVLGASTQMSPFEAIWPGTHRALLPLVGKAVVVHLLEQLRDLGHRHFRVARHLQQPFIRHRIGQGTQWGVRIRYSDLLEAELARQTLAEFGELVFLRADEPLWIEDKLPLARPATTLLENIVPGLYRFNTDQGRIDHAPLAQSALPQIGSITHYLNLNFTLSSRNVSQQTIPGTAVHRDAVADWKVKLAPDAIIGGKCFVGKHCQVSRGAILEQRCVLGNGVFVDQAARLKNCVVLPNTYIGQAVSLRDCVVSPKGALHVSGDFVAAHDPTVIGCSRRATSKKTGIPLSFAQLGIA